MKWSRYEIVFSNFDVHQLLVDVAEMKFGDNREPEKTRGISLFRTIPTNRCVSC